jgi:outer membrane protein TolC
MAKAKFEAFQDQRNKLFYEVQKKWYQLYRLDQTIDILQENIEILETFESVTLQKYETDQVGQADVLRVQIEKEDLKTRLELEKDNREVAVREFNTLLNRQQDQDVVVADTLRAQALSRSEAELERTVRQQNPQLTKTEYEMASARSLLKAARKAGMPKFGVGIDYMVTGSRSMSVTDNGKDAILARAGIKLPLFRGKYRAQEKQAQIELRAVEDRQEAAADRLQTQLDQALRDYREGQRRIKLYKEVQIQRTRQAIEILTEEYATAATDFEELLRLQRKLLDYELARDRALVKQNSAVALIEYLHGKYNVNPEEIEITN